MYRLVSSLKYSKGPQYQLEDEGQMLSTIGRTIFFGALGGALSMAPAAT